MNVSSMNNISTNNTSPSVTAFYIYYYGTFVILTAINIPGNLLVICTIMRYHKLRQPGNYFFVSLACSDLLLAIFYPVYNISHLEHVPSISRPLGKWIVAQVMGLEMCSSYHLVGITITRYIAVTRSLRYHSIITTHVVVVGITFIWICSQASSVILYIAYDPGRYDLISRYEEIFPVTHAAILFVIQLGIPLLIMLSLYIKIASIARRQAKVMSSEIMAASRSQSRHNVFTIMRTELKATLMVSLLLGCFILAWTPMIIYFFVEIMCETCNPGKYVRATVRILLYMNSAVNVFVYVGRLGDFREYLKKDVSNFLSLFSCKDILASSPNERPIDNAARQYDSSNNPNPDYTEINDSGRIRRY